MIKKILLLILLSLLFSYYIYHGFAETVMFADFGRDLTELSNLWTHRMVWLGPQLHVGFPASPIYYYLLFPALVISGGSAYSLVVSQALFAILALGFISFKLLKKSFLASILITLVIGFSPWFITGSSLPWNGHMYVSFTLFAVSCLYFDMPIFVSALALGTAIAIHPAALLVIPYLVYKWLIKKNKLKNIFLITLGLLIPWSPIIIFEVITKGYLTRQWLAIGSQSVSSLPPHSYYFLGVMCSFIFLVSVNLAKHKLGLLILAFIAISYVASAIKAPFYPIYSISEKENLVKEFIKESGIDKSKKYAVVSLIDEANSAPQADNYRFFLRIRGVNVLNIDEYPTADYLILFVEVPNYEWKSWSDYTTERFGERKLLNSYHIQNIDIGLYQKD